MNIFLIKLLGFLIGLFITLFIIDYYDNKRKTIETFQTTPPIIPSISSNVNQPNTQVINNEASFIPYKSFKYMCINTYNDIDTYINNTLFRWFECDLDKKLINNININENHYFTFDKMINMKKNTISENGSYGADINGIELRGPKSFYFANNIETNELNEFSILMTIKIKDINAKDNILFELTGNTQEINKDKPQYFISMVNVNIRINKNNNYDFIITIGDSIYSGTIDNIEKTTLQNNDFIVIGLVYTSTDIKLMINKQVYSYKTKDNFKVKLGSTPIIINKNGLMNIVLYNFVYYKSAIPSNEYLLYLKHNYYYLSGLNKVVVNTQKPEQIQEIKPRNELDIKLKELEDKIDKKIDMNIQDSSAKINTNVEYKKIPPFDIGSIKDTEVNSIFSPIF
jgi:hypothetical protein